MKRLYNYVILTLLTVGIATQLKAQYPVQVVPTITSPASLNLSDYYTGTVPKLTVSITNRDLQQPMLNVRLRVSISNNTIQLKSDETKSYTSVMLTPGVPTRLTGLDLEQYLNPENLIFQGFTKQEYLRTGQLPEGLYNFCFQVIEANTNRVLSRSNSCALAWISKTEPPLLNTPFNRSNVVAKNPTFIPFNWTPRHRNSANNAINTSYTFEIVEILDNKVDPNAVFASSPVLFTTTVTSSTLLYGPAQPQLIVGKSYAWRVRAVPSDPTKEYDEFRNNGYSDIYSFTYSEDLPPFEIEEYAIENNQLTLKWNKVKDFDGLYHVQFENNGALSKKVVTTSNTYSLNDVSNKLYPDLLITSNGNKRIKAYVSYFATSGERVTQSVYRVDVGNVDPNGPSGKSNRRAGDTANYAPSDKTPATNAIATRSSLFQGRIQWAYFNSSDAKTTINATDNNPVASSVLTKSDPPTEKFSLEGATVKLYFEKDGRESLVKTAVTDDYGHYKIPLVKADGGKYIVKIEHKSGLFSKSQAYAGLELNKINTESKYIGYSDHTLFLNNAEIDVNIFAPQLASSEVEGFKVEVYLESNKYYNTYGKVPGQLNNDGSELNDNRSTFKKIGELTNNSGFVKVLPKQNNISSYLVVLTRSGYPSKTVTVAAPNMFMRSTHIIEYEVTPAIYGRVTANNRTLSRTNVELKFRKSDVRGELKHGKVFGENVFISQQTDVDGLYSIEIPLLKENAKVDITLSNRVASAIPSYGSITVGKKVRNEFNHDFRNTTYTFVGQLMKDYNNSPLAGVMITHPRTGKSVRTTKDGFFLLQLNYNQDDKIRITCDGYKSQEVSVASLEKIDISLPANDSEKSKTSNEWASAITKLPWVNVYLKGNKDKVANAGMFKGASGEKDLNTVYGQLIQNDIEAVGGITPIGAIKMTTIDILVSMGIEVKGNAKPGKIQIFKDDKLFKEIIIRNAGDKGIFKGPAGYYRIKITPLGGNETDFTPYDEDMRLITSVNKQYYGMLGSEDLTNSSPLADNNYMPLEVGMFISAQNDDKEIIFRPKEFLYEVTFTITSKEDGKPLKDAEIFVSDVQQGNGGTDENGKITIYRGVSLSNSYEYKVNREKYNTVVKMVEHGSGSKVNVTVELEKMADVVIKKIGGFEVNVTKVTTDPSDKGNWIVSGSLVLPDNDVFTVNGRKKTADFKDWIVTLESRRRGEMVPILDNVFEESIIQGEAFGAYAVAYQNLKMVKAPDETDYIRSIIKAARVNVVLSGNTSGNEAVKNVMNELGGGAWLMQKKDRGDGELIKGEVSANKGTDNYTSLTTVFQAPPPGTGNKKSVDDLQIVKTFDLKFEKEGKLTLDVMGELKFDVSKNDAQIDQYGITLSTELPIPNIFSSLKDKFPIENIRINKSLEGIDVLFNVSDQDPFEMRIQKINSSLTDLTLNNLGSVNCGIEISGLVWLNNKGEQSGERGNVMVLNYFKLNKVSDGFTLEASARVDGDKGIEIKGLSFKTELGEGITFSLNTAEETFEFNVGGTVNYVGTGSAAASKVFGEDGITVDFRLRTKDWAFMMKAQRDIEIKFGVVTVEINTFLLNVGYGVDMQTMSHMLKAREKGADSKPNNDGFEEPDVIETGKIEYMVEESQTAWAIGVSGGLKFPIKKLDVGLSGRFVIANIDDELKFALDSFALSIETPAAEVAVSASLSISNTVTQIAGSGKFTVMGGGFATSFHYKETDAYYDIGAQLKVSLPTGVSIPTGPISWLAIGGGFNVQLARNEAGSVDGFNKIAVNLNGEVTATGGSRKTLYLDVVDLSVLYEGMRQGCVDPMLQPVSVKGQVNLMIKEEKWAEVKAVVDLCYLTFLLTIHAEVPEMVKGMPNILADGVVYAASGRKDPKDGKYYGPLFYLGINTTLTTDILMGKANIALGINVNEKHPSLIYSPDVSTSMDKLDQEVMQKVGGARYFHGVVVDAGIDIPGDEKSFDIDVGPLPKFGLSYKYGGKFDAKVFVNFKPNTAEPKEFKVEATIDLDASASAYVSEFRISGSIDVYAHVVGGYTEARQWYANGNFDSQLKMSTGSGLSSGCHNKFGVSIEKIYRSFTEKLFRDRRCKYKSLGCPNVYEICGDWCINCCCSGTIKVMSTRTVKEFVRDVVTNIGVQVCVDVGGSFKIEGDEKSFSIGKK